MFTDRAQAGRLLAEKLEPYKGPETVVLAIPRGGLPVGSEIASALDAPLDVILSKKIGHPANKEYAIGAVSLSSVVLDRQAEEVSPAYIESECERIREVLKEKQQMYYKHRKPANLKNKTLIITDDGIATGNTVLSTIELAHKESPRMIILAIPVAPASAIKKLQRSPYTDRIICLEVPEIFHAVGAFYRNFNQVTDREAIAILERHS